MVPIVAYPYFNEAVSITQIRLRLLEFTQMFLTGIQISLKRLYRLCPKLNEVVWSCPKLNKAVPLGPNFNRAIAVCWKLI